MLGLEAKYLSYVLYIFPDPKYTTFEIQKKSKATRIIEAPTNRLKVIQRLLADLLADCIFEIDEKKKRKPVSHGFRRGRSILTNARPHTNRRFVLNLDIENFFPTINFGRVRGFFIKNNDFQLHPKVATIIAQIACNGKALPQGSPCSPIISDLIAHILDVRIVRLAKQHRCTYSRYADDLTLSTNQKTFPPELASCSDDGQVWTLGEPLVATIANAGFSINRSKTRMQCRISRQTVTGLTVNRKVNIRDEYFRAARLMCHSLFKVGNYHRPHDATLINTTYQIEGILNHIDHVRSASDNRDADTKKQRPLAFYYVWNNLYVIKTPERGATGESKIEDCFEPGLLQTPFEGKTFNAEDEKLGPTEFGKVALAGIVRTHADKIIFSGFEPLLNRIVATIKDYQLKTTNA